MCFRPAIAEEGMLCPLCGKKINSVMGSMPYECPWCKEYVIYLNEVAKNSGCDKVYYFNILNDRKDNTEKYQEIVNILKDYLPYDEEGNKRIYVPAVIAVKDGKIISFDDETSKDTKGYDTPQEYWKNEDLDALKKKLSEMFKNTSNNICTSGCNKQLKII